MSTRLQLCWPPVIVFIQAIFQHLHLRSDLGSRIPHSCAATKQKNSHVGERLRKSGCRNVSCRPGRRTSHQWKHPAAETKLHTAISLQPVILPSTTDTSVDYGISMGSGWACRKVVPDAATVPGDAAADGSGGTGGQWRRLRRHGRRGPHGSHAMGAPVPPCDPGGL